jgi:hypothetical protein
MVRSARSGARLEPSAARPSFETHHCAMLLGMGASFVVKLKKGAAIRSFVGRR